ncbi:MAG: squalene--hopene cyclase [Dehalococcoidia bacterium]
MSDTLQRTDVAVGSRAPEGARRQDSFADRLGQAVERSRSFLLDLQSSGGYWSGELEANCSIQAEYLLMTHFLGIADKERWRKVVNYLKAHQLPDGGWPVWYGGPGDLSIAVESYFAMKLAGVDPNDPSMARAREFIFSNGGVANTRVFTKLWLALFGQWDWRQMPIFPAEVIMLPQWFPFNVYEFASWARGTIVSCMVLLNTRPVCPVPDSARIDELFPPGGNGAISTNVKNGRALGWHGFFQTANRVLRVLEASPVKPLRRAALRKAERWILERQEADGSWAGIQPPWVYSLMALKSLGYSMDHPVMRKGVQGFQGFARETEDAFWIDPCVSPVWDTCLAMLALQDSGLPPTHPALADGTEWLLDQQVLDHRGDWQVKRPKLRPGGWAFEFANKSYPDTDDSAMVLIALYKMGRRDDPRMRRALDRGLEWLVGMQSKGGGWGSFDADNTRAWVGEIPFCDFGAVLDPPTEDVTAHAVELLGRMGYDTSYRPAAQGLKFLKAHQESDGSWWGRWGVNYIYGLGSVMPALKWMGEDLGQPYIRKAVAWLEAHQNADGGWGESCESYRDPSLRGRGPSTASQTAWALIALVAAGEAGSEATRKGVEYLLSTQQDFGSWDEPQFTGTGFPGDFMINYHLYRHYWPLMALGQYRMAIQGGAGGR